jgi:ABC-type branched-subunit amino acid transport system ATPase component
MAGQAVILSVRDVSAGYGSVPVLRNISFAQREGEVLGVIGHNGMGKTTLLRVLMGLLRAASGSIEFAGAEITTSRAWRRSLLGISYVPQGDLGFPDLTVAETLALATAAKGRGDFMTVAETVGWFPRLADLLNRRSAALSGGERQLLAIARAVARSPRLLLLDEMTEGVQPSIVEEIARCLQVLRHRGGMSMLIVDQELAFVASLASRVLVMQKGQVVRELGADSLSDPDVLGVFGTALQIAK